MYTKGAITTALMNAVKAWMDNHYEEAPDAAAFRAWAMTQVFLVHKDHPDDTLVYVPVARVVTLKRFLYANLVDMHESCGFQYFDLWRKANVTGELSQDEWSQWYSNHCGKCQYMSEICMYGER